MKEDLARTGVANKAEPLSLKLFLNNPEKALDSSPRPEDCGLINICI